MSLLLRNIGKTLLSSNTRLLVGQRAMCVTSVVNHDEIEKMVKNNKVVVFMKGNPEQPRCGFSNAVVQILRMHNVTYDSHDVLSNEALRQGILIYFFQFPLEMTNFLF